MRKAAENLWPRNTNTFTCDTASLTTTKVMPQKNVVRINRILAQTLFALILDKNIFLHKNYVLYSINSVQGDYFKSYMAFMPLPS
jgi:hypothetical protein